MRRRALALGAAGWLGGCATAPFTGPPGDASRQLQQLLADSDDAKLERNPVEKIFRGDFSDLARHGDELSAGWIAAERGAVNDDLRRLAAIDRTRLAPAERLAYDTFGWQRRIDRREYESARVALWAPLRLEHLHGWHLFFPTLSSGRGAAPYRNAADYDGGLARIDGFIAWLGRALAHCRDGLSRGVVQPRVVVERLIAQFDTFATQDLDASPYYGPIRALPADMPAADRERLTRAYAAALRQRLAPAFARMRDALRDEVLPRARASVGLAQMPGGTEYYRFLVEARTTTALAPDAIHRLGLAEVERIGAAMDAVRAQVGFAGTRAQFFEFLRSDPRFKPASADALGDAYRAVGARVQAALPRLFSMQPKTRLEIRPTPGYQAETDAGARYMAGTPDGKRPGVFYYNTHDLDSRSTTAIESLYLHEAVPGHHFQGSLAQENEALPKLLRFDGNTAYWEGWALYAESLGAELGLFTDPYQRFGNLDAEMLRALRLVVDTGLHTMGWSREQAIDTMLAKASMSRTEATAEVERYIANPAQALAYKVGQMTISRLRDKAAVAFGAAFDIRQFHAQVLDSGALPLPVLEAKVDDWIAAAARR